MKYTAITVFAAIALASAPAFAYRHDAHARARYADSDMASAAHALDARAQTLQREGNVFRIGAVQRQQIADQQREIRRLQKKLNGGGRVDRYTLYHALGPDYPNYFAS
jgi:hypothetical protein